MISKLEDLLAKSQALKHGLARVKRVKLVRSELNKAKRSSAGNQQSKETKQGSFNRIWLVFCLILPLS